MEDFHQAFIRRAIQIAQRAREHGNHPFGALLVDPHGQVLLEAENTVMTARDCTGHAELNLVRQAYALFDADFLAQCTLYTSTEPCPMCAGAIFWANIRQVVYGLSENELYTMVGESATEVLALPCRELFARGKKPIQVIGPLFEEEARLVHLGFWK